MLDGQSDVFFAKIRDRVATVTKEIKKDLE